MPLFVFFFHPFSSFFLFYFIFLLKFFFFIVCLRFRSRAPPRRSVIFNSQTNLFSFQNKLPTLFFILYPFSFFFLILQALFSYSSNLLFSITITLFLYLLLFDFSVLLYILHYCVVLSFSRPHGREKICNSMMPIVGESQIHILWLLISNYIECLWMVGWPLTTARLFMTLVLDLIRS